MWPCNVAPPHHYHDHDHDEGDHDDHDHDEDDHDKGDHDYGNHLCPMHPESRFSSQLTAFLNVKC